MLSEAVHSITGNFLTLLKELIIPAAVVVVCTVAPPAIIAWIGFTTGGDVAADSVAAGIHATIGNVVAGSAFAALQALGTAPLVTAGVGAAVGAAGVAWLLDLVPP